MLSSQNLAALCFFPSPTAQCRRGAASSSSRPCVIGGGRSGGGDGQFDSAREELTSTTTRSNPSTASHPAPAGGVIMSPSNPFVKHCVKLRQSASYRRSWGCALVVGLTPIREIAYRYRETTGHSGGEEGEPCVERLLLLDGAEEVSGTSALLRELGIAGGRNSSSGDRVVRVSTVVMKKLAGLQTTDSTEAVALMRMPKNFHDLSGRPKGEAPWSSWFSSPPHRILVLDGIQDPGNLGTLLRSTMAFKWDGVFLLPSCCDPFNDKALRAARGASFQLTIVAGDWAQLEDLRDKYQMKMLAAHPENINDTSFDCSSFMLSQTLVESLTDTPLCLALGSEGHGLSQQTLHLSELVHIPMMENLKGYKLSDDGDKKNMEPFPKREL